MKGLIHAKMNESFMIAAIKISQPLSFTFISIQGAISNFLHYSNSTNLQEK